MVESSIPASALGAIDGLVGHYDGDPTNDLTNRAGVVVCEIGADDCTEERIFNEFGETCE